MNFIDLLILLIFILNILIYYKKGLIKSTSHILLFILSIVLTKLTQPFVNSILRDSTFINNIALSFTKNIQIDEILESNVESFIQGLHLPDFLNKFILYNNNLSITSTINLQSIQTLFANIISNLLSFIIAYLIIFIFLRIVFSIFNFTAVSLPLISTINKLLGSIFGFLKSLFLIWFIFIIIMIIGSDSIKLMIYNSTIAKILYNNNLLLLFILSFFSSFT